MDIPKIEETLQGLDNLRAFNMRYLFLFTDLILATRTDQTEKGFFEKKFGSGGVEGNLHTRYGIEN